MKEDANKKNFYFDKFNDAEISNELDGEIIDVLSVQNALMEIQNLSIAEVPSLTQNQDRHEHNSRRHSRSIAFSIAVKKLYNYTCAVCRSKLSDPTGRPEVQSAHIYPKKLNGSDDVRNGICLCRMHHWAFDVGWIAISNNYKIIVRQNVPNEPEFKLITEFSGKPILLPEKRQFAPHILFLQESRKYMGFE
jgi:putative restriction endonuclease